MSGSISRCSEMQPTDPKQLETEPALDGLDRRIIRATQGGLPLVPQPYHAVAEELGVDPDEVIARMRWMLEGGVIRRIGAVPNHYRLGYKANGMSVWDVPEERIDYLPVGADIDDAGFYFSHGLDGRVDSRRVGRHGQGDQQQTQDWAERFH